MQVIQPSPRPSQNQRTRWYKSLPMGMTRRRQIRRTAQSKQYRHNQDITARTPVPPLVQSKGAKREEGYKREVKKQSFSRARGESTKNEMILKEIINKMDDCEAGLLLLISLCFSFLPFLSFFPSFLSFFFLNMRICWIIHVSNSCPTQVT